MNSVSYLNSLRCVTCGVEYDIDLVDYTCPACGPLTGTLDVIYDYSALASHFTPEILRERRGSTIWRYHELLPCRDVACQVPIPVGSTPLYRLDCDLGFTLPKSVLVKDDTGLPSGSTKDRATAIAITRAREKKAPAIAAASTGNAASSLAMFAARASLPCYIFAPAGAPPAKLIQIRAHGAKLLAVEGSYDQAFDLCQEVCQENGFYNRNTATNPFLSEGKKTLALEIWEQLGYQTPAAIFVPVGDGCIIGGVYKGFRDLFELNLIERIPKLIGVQAEGSAAITECWELGEELCSPASANTIADSISVSMPRDQVKALRAIRSTDGCFITVTDKAISKAMALLSARAGILVEPAAATPLAGLDKAMSIGKIREDEQVVLIHTGHGLKDIDAVQNASIWNEPIYVSPQISDVNKAISSGFLTSLRPQDL